MFPTDLRTWVLYILLTVMLGAIGSGFWETIFKPVSTGAVRIFLRASTFGLTSSRNSIYKEIARRSFNKPILFILFLIVMVSSALAGIASSQYSNANVSEEVAVQLEKEAEKEEENLKNLSQEELTKKIAAGKTAIRALQREITSSKLLGAIFLFTLTTYIWARNSYISSAISYFDQCLAICSPYISAIEKTELLARFASISSTRDYELLLKSLSEVAVANALALPKFGML